MKSITKINKIIETQECSICDIEKLNETLHREGILPLRLVVRFRPLYADFDIVTTTWLYKKCDEYYPVGKIENLMNVINSIK